MNNFKEQMKVNAEEKNEGIQELKKTVKEAIMSVETTGMMEKLRITDMLLNITKIFDNYEEVEPVLKQFFAGKYILDRKPSENKQRRVNDWKEIDNKIETSVIEALNKKIEEIGDDIPAQMQATEVLLRMSKIISNTDELTPVLANFFFKKKQEKLKSEERM